MLRRCGCRRNVWSSHISTKRTVVEAYEQLARKGVITADARQRYMSEACTSLLQFIHQCYADEAAGKVSPYTRPCMSASDERGHWVQASRSLRRSIWASLAKQARRAFPDSVTRTLGLLEAENIGVVEKRGLYLWGDVGIGKTMILDLFDLCATPYAKRRSHLHSFMSELEDRLFRAEMALTRRRRSAVSPKEKRALDAVRPINVVVQEVLHETPILCFDEFQTFDVAHAALLAAFFSEALREGLFLITTSNRPPEDLCREAAERHHQLIFLHPNTKANVERLMRRVEHAFGAGGGELAWIKEDTLWHHGRSVVIPLRCAGCAVFDFTDICGAREGLSSADIQLIALQFHTVIVTNVPQMGNVSSNAAHQFVVLVDEMYQNNVKLLFTSSVPWTHLMDSTYSTSDVRALADVDSGRGGDATCSAGGSFGTEVYSEGEDDRSGHAASYNFRNEEELMSFARIRSRLNEMGSASYLLRDHRHFTYKEDFEALSVTDTGMEIITDKARGNELYATRDFEMRSAIHEETVLCCSQSMDDFKDEAPVERALKKFRQESCAGRMKVSQRIGYSKRMQQDWVRGGANCSDSAMVGSSTSFTYYIMEDNPTKISGGAAAAAYAAAFATGKCDSMPVPAVRPAYTQPARNADTFCASSLDLLCDLLDMDSEERAFAHARRWPDLMGAAAVNDVTLTVVALRDVKAGEALIFS
ncbi:AFG1-like ATPase family protein [Leishmania donovani]|uniref:AFG1-like ATPase family protein n=1 Tax=Leishmania donovani TaxID=5661 RepID=A0A504XKQ4_LEIDO|nr:AFG1-like ATPase family protein [Leishmania donovani]